MLENKFEELGTNELVDANGGVIISLAIGFGVGYIATTNFINAVHSNLTRKW